MRRTKVFAVLIAAMIVVTMTAVLPIRQKSAISVTVNAAENVLEGRCGDKANYSYNPMTETLTIFGTGDMWDNMKWKRVIREEAKNIIIENGITSIGSYAFDKFYNDVKEMKIADTVKTIKECAIRAEGTLTIPASVTTVERYAISATKVIIKGNMKDYKIAAFGSCPPEEIEICGKAETLGAALLIGCDIEDIAVTLSKNNKKCKVVNGCLLSANGKTLYYYIGASKANIPNTVRTIAPGAFANQAISKVILGENVVTIGEYAFNNLKLGRVTLKTNAKLKHIGRDAFSDIKKVTLKSNVTMEPKAFYWNTMIYTTKKFKQAKTVLSTAKLGKYKLKVEFSKVAKADGYQIRVKRGKKTYNYKTVKNEFSVTPPKALKKDYNVKFSYQGYNYEYLNKIEGTPAYVTVRPYKTSKNKKKIYGKWSSKMILTK